MEFACHGFNQRTDILNRLQFVEHLQFSFALEDYNLPIRKRLFFTATPRHYDIRKKDKEGDTELVYSMDRTEVYGRVAHTLSFAKAARDKIICDYKVVISVVTSDMVNDYLLKHGEVIVAGNAVKARQVALQIALQKAVEKYGVSRIFTFHGSVASARSFTSDDGEGICHHLTDFRTLHVSGDMPTAAREDQMKTFRQASKAIMSNARCLTEGVDVPAVDMVAFMSPRKSKVDIVQATGRAMRKLPGKEFGYVMVPLFLDVATNETIEEALHRTDFSDVWDVLAAMKEQDDVLTDIIRQMREDKGRAGGYDESRFRQRIEVLGPSVSLEAIRNSITAECLENLGSSWDERYGELLAYRAEHGDVNVSTDPSNKLWVWVRGQRQARTRGICSADRIRRLDEIGFNWDPRESKWDEVFSELLKYKSEHGDVNVPDDWKTGLGTWVGKQRSANKRGALLIERFQRLSEIGFVWDIGETKWEEKFGELLAYKEKHGDVNIPIDRKSELWRWISTQRIFKKRGKLLADRIRRLDEIGFIWDLLEAQWESRFSDLLAYKAEHGNVNVPQSEQTALGSWVATQRLSRKNGEISPERIRRLDDVGFSWEFLESQWELRFSELLAYKTTHGNVDVPQNEQTGLGKWVSKQRTARKKGKVSPDRISRLEEIGFEWILKKKKREKLR